MAVDVARVERPLLKNTIEARATAERVWLLGGAREDDLEIEHEIDLLRALVPLLDGRRSRGQLAAALAARHAPAAVQLAIDELAQAGVLIDAAALDVLPATVRERAERQLVLLGRDAGDDALRAQERLMGARVALLGVGGFGSWAALALAGAGVGTLVGVDHDRVERSNLNRQVLYGDADIGAGKARAAARAVARHNPAVRFEAVERRIDGPGTVAEIVAGCDLVIDSIDEPPHLANRWVSEGCFAVGVPFLTISQQPPLIRVGPLYVPGRTGCVACMEAGHRARYPLYEAIEHAEQLARQHASSGPATGAGAVLGVHEALRFLVGGDTETVGCARRIDLATLHVVDEPVHAQPDCPICASGG
jgi:molybdopterin/thiamine biosynthesis adenylyltransferase